MTQAPPSGAGCPLVIVVAGVSGAGKTTVGRALAVALGRRFLDADDYHDAESVARMRRGEALTDVERAPWLAALAAQVTRLHADGVAAVLACSALRRRYRAALVPAGVPAGAVAFVHLDVDPALASRRVAGRDGHFMPATLVASQFATLEPPDDAVRVDAAQPVPEIVRQVRAALGC